MVFGVYSKCKKNRHKNLPRPMAKRCEQGACAETMAHISRRTSRCDEPLSPGLQPDTAPPGVRLFCRFSPGKNSAQKIEALWQCGVPGYRRRSASRFLQLNRGAKSAPCAVCPTRSRLRWFSRKDVGLKSGGWFLKRWRLARRTGGMPRLSANRQAFSYRNCKENGLALNFRDCGSLHFSPGLPAPQEMRENS